MTDYPYMLSNNKIAPIIGKIQQAARPQKFTIEVLRTLGFTSTNDRAFIPLFKKLGFPIPRQIDTLSVAFSMFFLLSLKWAYKNHQPNECSYGGIAVFT